MNTYLKIDNTLPAGLPYLNLNTFAIPKSLVDIGGLASAFRFTAGLEDLIGTTASVVYDPIANTDGYSLGNFGYIDTGLKETSEFLWVGLVKISSGGAYTPVISNFVEVSQSTTGRSNGNNLGKATAAVKLTSTYDSSGAFNAAGATAGIWGLYALSKKPETGGFKYHYAFKPAGGALQQASSPLGTAPNNTESNIFIGWAPKANVLIPAASTTINLATVHTKGLTPTELTTLMNDLITELAEQGIVL